MKNLSRATKVALFALLLTFVGSLGFFAGTVIERKTNDVNRDLADLLRNDCRRAEKKLREFGVTPLDLEMAEKGRSTEIADMD